MLGLYKSLCKVVNTFIIEMKIEKIDFKKFLYFRKKPGFDSSNILYRQKM